MVILKNQIDMRRLLLCWIFLAVLDSGFAQSASWTQVQDRSLIELRYSLRERPVAPRTALPITPTFFMHSQTPTQPANLAAAPVPAAWKYQDLAFFCKLEVKMEKALNLPVKFRLGEVQAVEKREGKLKTHFAAEQ